jgi:hypothetical protein
MFAVFGTTMGASVWHLSRFIPANPDGGIFGIVRGSCYGIALFVMMAANLIVVAGKSWPRWELWVAYGVYVIFAIAPECLAGWGNSSQLDSPKPDDE